MKRIHVALAALVIGACAHGQESNADPPVSRGGVRFSHSDLDATSARVDYERGSAVTAVALSMALGVHAAELTLSKGFTFFDTGESLPGGDRRHGAYVLHFFSEPPEGRPVVRMTELSGTPDSDALMDARSVLDALQIPEGKAIYVGVAPRKPDPGPEVTTEHTFSERLLVEDLLVGRIRSMTWVAARHARPLLCVAGDEGAVFLDGDGEVQRTVVFDRKGGRHVPIDLGQDGDWEFMNRGGGWQPVGLLDADGNTLWRYPTRWSAASPNDMAAGDLDGDGDLEFVVGTNGGGGVLVLDHEGQVVESWDATNVSSVEIADIDHDGADEVIHSTAKPSAGILVRETSTDATRRIPGIVSFSLAHDAEGRTQLATVADGELRFFDLDGVNARFPVERSGKQDVDAAWVRISATRPWLAVGRTIGASAGASEVYVFDPDGELAFQREYPASYVAVAPGLLRTPPTVLVGSGSSVWEYALEGMTHADEIQEIRIEHRYEWERAFSWGAVFHSDGTAEYHGAALAKPAGDRAGAIHRELFANAARRILRLGIEDMRPESAPPEILRQGALRKVVTVVLVDREFAVSSHDDDEPHPLRMIHSHLEDLVARTEWKPDR